MSLYQWVLFIALALLTLLANNSTDIAVFMTGMIVISALAQPEKKSEKKATGWHWIRWGYSINGPNLIAHASSMTEAENEIEAAFKDTAFDRDDYTTTALYTRAFQGSIDDLTPDSWSLADGT